MTVNVDCPCSICGPTYDSRRQPDSGDSRSIEVGMKFQRHARQDQRRPLLQGEQQHRHAHR